MAIYGYPTGNITSNGQGDSTTLVAQPVDEQLDLDFINDVRTGLAGSPKRLSSRFFYDAEGSRLFGKIMHLPEYYLTRSEYEILDRYKADLLARFSADHQSFSLIELGAGDGWKTKLLLDYAMMQRVPLTYWPVDISADALDGLCHDLHQQWPDLLVRPLHTDYTTALNQLAEEDNDIRKVLLFLGSNIGNFTPADALTFYQSLSERLRPGDLVLTGFDLQKHPAIISAAYNDSQGLTRAFNLNLLARINRELGADFDLTAFSHYETYNPETGEARSYLVSERAQSVQIEALNQLVSFDDGEVIHTEISRKFTRAGIEQLAHTAGFRVTDWFTDHRRYFVDALFEKV